MNAKTLRPGLFRRVLCLFLAVVVATTQSASVLAQTFGAQQAVRQRVSGLQQGASVPGLSEEPQPASETPPVSAEPQPGAPTSPGYVGAKLDTAYVSPNASVLLVVRPAQVLGSPVAQMFPVEVATAAGMKHLGVDPAEVDEVVGFVDLSNPVAPAYGVTIKFSNPFRATSIPVDKRAHARLAELSGKKYLKSAHPIMPSFYGPNNKTLVLAPDMLMQQLVPTASQPKSGALLDRVRDVPAGSDLYLIADMNALRGLIQMGTASAAAQIPPDAKQYLDALNLISAAELKLNVSAPGPSSLVFYANDEAAAQQLETMAQEALNKSRALGQLQQSEDPIQQAMARYQERISKPFQPVRNGTSVTIFQIEGQDDSQQQAVSVVMIGILVALLLPAIQAAREAARQAQEKAAGGATPEGLPPGVPGAPEAPSDGSEPPRVFPPGEPGSEIAPPASPDAERR